MRFGGALGRSENSKKFICFCAQRFNVAALGHLGVDKHLEPENRFICFLDYSAQF